MPDSSCPCGSGKPYGDCCKPLHDGKPATTAEALMRSRYVAYVMKNVDYLMATTHPKMKPQPDPEDIRRFAESVSWLGLEIVRTRFGASKDKMGKVEFIARYIPIGDDPETLHENSRFKRFKGKWYYSGGDLLD